MFGTSALLVLLAVAAGTILVASLAVYAHYNADVPAASAFRNLELTVALWGGAELGMYLSPASWDLIGLVYTVRLVFSGLAAVLAIVFVAEYTQSELLNRPAARRLLWGGFGAAMGLWLVNPTGLAYTSLAAESFQGITVVAPSFGPGFAAYFVFLYLFLVVTFGVLGRFLLDATNVYRTQTALIGVAFLVVVLGTIVLLLGLSPHRGIDLGPVFNALGGLLIWAAIYKYEFLTVVPLAKESIIETIADPVLVVDEDDTLIYANTEAETLGITDDQIGTRLESLLPGIGAATREDDIFRLEESTAAGPNVFEPTAETIVDHHGIEHGQVVVMHDVTERYRREQRLEEFASIVSHDLRNPLSIAGGYVDLAHESGETDPLDSAQDALARMEQLIDDLLMIAQSGYDDTEAEPLSLSEFAQTAWGTVATGESELRVESDRTVHANGSLFREVLENLFRNSVEHGSTGSRTGSDDAVEHGSTNPDSQARQDSVEHGSTGSRTQSVEHSSTGGPQPAADAAGDTGAAVTVRVGARDDGFYVADDGVGIPKDERSQLFEPGYTTTSDGTGLGLYIVRQVADAHGWQVTVSESKEGGVRYDFVTESVPG